jgi:hypothetical protein
MSTQEHLLRLIWWLSYEYRHERGTHRPHQIWLTDSSATWRRTRLGHRIQLRQGRRRARSCRASLLVDQATFQQTTAGDPRPDSHLVESFATGKSSSVDPADSDAQPLLLTTTPGHIAPRGRDQLHWHRLANPHSPSKSQGMLIVATINYYTKNSPHPMSFETSGNYNLLNQINMVTELQPTQQTEKSLNYKWLCCIKNYACVYYI